MRVLIAGASGFIGTALVERLTGEGHDVFRLVRRRAESSDEVTWSPGAGIIDFTIMDRIDVAPQVGGDVMQVFVAENARVAAGDPVLQLDATLAKIAVTAEGAGG